VRALRPLLAALLGLTLLAPAASAAPPEVSAPSAIVVEPTSGAVVHAKAADRRRSIASATKLMTALLALEELRLGQTLTAAPYRALPVESKIDLRAGERMRVADLLRALLLESANDAAVTLAEGVSGSRARFVRAMNRRAEELGLRRTRFANPIGLDERGNHSTARDLARLAVRLRRFAFFRTTVDRPVATLRSGGRARIVRNRNQLVRNVPWVDGVKTGRTLGAGYVLVGSGTRRQVAMVSVVLGAPSEAARNADTLALLRWGTNRYRRITALRRDQPLASVPIRYRRGAEVQLVAQRTVRRVLPRGARPALVERVPRDVAGPLRAGHPVGSVEVRWGARVLARVPLVTADAIPEAGPTQQAKEWATRPLILVLALAAVTGSVMLARARPARAARPARR